MRTTITLDDDVFEAARAQARASDKTLGEVVSRLARRGLRTNAGTTDLQGLPVFPVKAGGEVIPSDRASRLLAEDGR